MGGEPADDLLYVLEGVREQNLLVLQPATVGIGLGGGADLPQYVRERNTVVAGDFPEEEVLSLDRRGAFVDESILASRMYCSMG